MGTFLPFRTYNTDNQLIIHSRLVTTWTMPQNQKSLEGLGTEYSCSPLTSPISRGIIHPGLFLCLPPPSTSASLLHKQASKSSNNKALESIKSMPPPSTTLWTRYGKSRLRFSVSLAQTGSFVSALLPDSLPMASSQESNSHKFSKKNHMVLWHYREISEDTLMLVHKVVRLIRNRHVFLLRLCQNIKPWFFEARGIYSRRWSREVIFKERKG